MIYLRILDIFIFANNQESARFSSDKMYIFLETISNLPVHFVATVNKVSLHYWLKNTSNYCGYKDG